MSTSQAQSPKETRSPPARIAASAAASIIESRGRAAIVGVRGDPEHPANFGRLCTKGSTLHLTAAARCHAADASAAPAAARGARRSALESDRLGRGDGRGGRALRRASSRSTAPNAVAFYVSGQLLTEDYYVFNKLAKGLVGTNNVDTNSRLCMSQCGRGLQDATLGADSPPCLLRRLGPRVKVLFITGSNMAFAHPILFPPHRGRAACEPRHEDHRGRPAPYRDGRRGGPASADIAGHGRRAVPRRCFTSCCGKG